MTGALRTAEWATTGVELVADFTGGTDMKILWAARIRHVPRLNLPTPKLTKKNLQHLPPNASEIVLAVLDARGRELQTVGFEQVARRYFDIGNPVEATIKGGPRDVFLKEERDIRFVRIPWSEDVRALSVSRTDVVPEEGAAGERQLKQRPLSIYKTEPAAGLPPAAIPPGAIEIDLPWAPPWAPGNPRPLPGFDQRDLKADGGLVDVQSVRKGPCDECFDILITGDGFSQEELPKFDELAEKLQEGLLKMEPFGELREHINWHRARVFSTDSGIENCPRRSPGKRTFFRVQGCWDDTDAPGYLGTTEVERMYWVVDHVAPIEDIELTIIIANCEEWGGHAWPRARMAVVTAYPQEDGFVGLAAHECAHTIALLAEEYISGTTDNPGYPDPNLARLPEVGLSVADYLQVSADRRAACKDTVWWKDLAVQAEKREDGAFKFVHIVGDAKDPRDPKCPMVPGGTPDVIGAFWGCQDIATRMTIDSLVKSTALPADAPARFTRELDQAWPDVPVNPQECDSWWDPRSAVYFRASPKCRMRFPSYDFCRVCQHLIRNRVLEACGLPLLGPLPMEDA
jgi:hypothetical protein